METPDAGQTGEAPFAAEGGMAAPEEAPALMAIWAVWRVQRKAPLAMWAMWAVMQLQTPQELDLLGWQKSPSGQWGGDG